MPPDFNYQNMKKLILILFAAILTGTISYSQVFIITDNQGVNITGDTITVDACNTVTFITHVQNSSAISRTVKVKKTHMEILAGTVNYFCWVNCYSPTVFISTQSLLMPAGYTTSGSQDLTCDYVNGGTAGNSLVAYTVYDENTPADSSIFYINYSCTDGIGDVFKPAISEAFPNPSATSSTIEYNIGTQQDGYIVLYNLLGSQVAKYNLYKPEGKVVINTSTLTPGAYFYSFFYEGRLIKTSKLIVTR